MSGEAEFIEFVFHGVADGDDAVGGLAAFVFDVFDGVAAAADAAADFGGVDVEDEGDFEFFFGDDAAEDAEPVVGVDDVEGAAVFADEAVGEL